MIKLNKHSVALASALTALAAVTFSAPVWSAAPIQDGVNVDELFVGVKPGPRTRAEVKEELRQARAAGTLSPTHEIGDTQDVLDAREAFAELQREVVTKNRAMLAQRQQAAIAKPAPR